MQEEVLMRFLGKVILDLLRELVEANLRSFAAQGGEVQNRYSHLHAEEARPRDWQGSGPGLFA